MGNEPSSIAGRTPLRRAAGGVPAGRWGVAVSGGADSVATLRLLARRAGAGGLDLSVVHLDHQLRGRESQEDARFVQNLAAELGLPILVKTREQVEGAMPSRPEGNGGGLSARMRQLRLEVYREAVARLGLGGIILGHHADDVAETLFMRLLRGSARSGTLGLAPLRGDQAVGGVRLLRPMLGVRRQRLRQFLQRMRCPWREDASNASAYTLRNRVRLLLVERPDVTEALLALAGHVSCAEAELDAAAPILDTGPRLADLAVLPPPILRRSLRRWLVARGVPESSAGPRSVDALEAMIDAAGPASVDLAGGVRVSRHRGRLNAAESDRTPSGGGQATADGIA